MPSDRDVPSSEASPTYCSVEDVYQLLQKEFPDRVGVGGEPGDEEVRDAILDLEAAIDTWTGASWRERQVVNERPELLEVRNMERYSVFTLSRIPVREPFDSGQGDKVEVWNGSSFEDYLSTQTQGRGNDYYVNGQRGHLFLRPLGSANVFWRGIRDRDDMVRVTYRYGETVVPRDVKRATVFLTAISLNYGEAIAPQGFGSDLDRLNLSDKELSWLRQAGTILQAHRGPSL